MKHVAVFLFGFVATALVTPAWGDAIANIRLDPEPVAALQFGQHVDITFDYEITTPGGVRIWARPISQGSLTPGYAASGSPLYPVGSGTGTGYFTITSGEALVDDIRFQIWTADQSMMILEFFYPVAYHFADHAIYNIQMDSPSPASVKFNDHVDISFDYATDYPGGVRIFPRPFTNGAPTPNYFASGSPLYPTGAGSGTAYFSVSGGDVTVDQVRFRMTSADQTQLLLEFFVPVEYEFHEVSVFDVSFDPPSPVGWLLNEDITVDFSYSADEPVRIWARPFTNGALTPNYAASGSPTYPAGTGTGNGTFTITAGDVTIDHVRFHVMDAAMTVTLLEYFVPVDIHFGEHLVVVFELEQPSPAYFTCNHNADLSFVYYTTEPTGVRIWSEPYTQGAFTPSGYHCASPNYPPVSGIGSSYLGASAPALVDHIHFLIRDDQQTQTLMEWWTPVRLHFGNRPPSAIEPEEVAPVSLAMFAPLPNPISSGTTLRYTLPADAMVSLKVLDVAGREVSVLVNERQKAGPQTVDLNPRAIPNGVYFCRLAAATDDAAGKAFMDTARLVLLR